MHLERPVVVIVPSFDGIYNFPTKVSKYILDVYSEVYGLDLHNPEDIIFVSGHKLLNLEPETLSKRSNKAIKRTDFRLSNPSYNYTEFYNPTGQSVHLAKADYSISDNNEHIRMADKCKRTLEEAYKQSVTDYIERHYGSKGTHSPITPYVNDLVSKNHCLVCSETFEAEENRLVWLFNWAGERPDVPNTEK